MYHAKNLIPEYFGSYDDKMGHATHRKKMIPRGKLDSRKSRVNQTVKDLR